MPRLGLPARGRVSLPALGLALVLAGCRAPAPGELAFDQATSRILAGDKEAALGNSPEAEKLAERFNAMLGDKLREAKDQAATGPLLTYCELRSDRICFLSHVPGLAGYRGERRERLLRAAWESAAAATRELRRRKDRQLGVGLRGSFVYGAVARGMGNEEPELGQGWKADREVLYDFFAPEGSTDAAKEGKAS